MSAIAARLLLLVLLLPLSLPAFALEDSPQNREHQAETLPEEQRDQFKALMTKHLDLGRVTAAIKAAMIKTFTADELKALADFYGSDVGKSAMAKMGTYMSEVMPATMSEVQSALTKAQGEAHKEQPNQGGQDKGTKEN